MASEAAYRLSKLVMVGVVVVLAAVPALLHQWDRVHDLAAAQRDSDRLARTLETQVAQTFGRIDRTMADLAPELGRPVIVEPARSPARPGPQPPQAVQAAQAAQAAQAQAAQAQAVQIAQTLRRRGQEIGGVDFAVLRADAARMLQIGQLPLVLDEREAFDIFRTHLQAPTLGLRIAKPRHDAASGKWFVLLSRRITGPDGAAAGALVAAVNLESLGRTYETMQLGPRGAMALHGGDGGLIARYPAVPDQVGKIVADAPSLSGDPRQATDGMERAASSVDGVERIVSYRRVADLPLFVVVGVATEDALRPLEARLPAYGAIWLAALAAAAALLFVQRRRRTGEKPSAPQPQTVSLIARRVGAVLDGLAESVVMFRPSGHIEHVNRAAERLFGRPAAELVGTSIATLVSVPAGARGDAVGWMVASNGTAREVTAVSAAGATKPVEMRAAAFQLEHEQLCSASFVDLTERREALRQARIDDARFQAVFNAGPSSLALLNPDGTVVEANAALLARAGTTRDAFLGADIVEAPCWPQGEGNGNWLRQAIEAARRGEPARGRVASIDEHGAAAQTDCTIEPIRDDKDEVAYLLLEVRDLPSAGDERLDRTDQPLAVESPASDPAAVASDRPSVASAQRVTPIERPSDGSAERQVVAAPIVDAAEHHASPAVSRPATTRDTAAVATMATAAVVAEVVKPVATTIAVIDAGAATTSATPIASAPVDTAVAATDAEVGRKVAATVTIDAAATTMPAVAAASVAADTAVAAMTSGAREALDNADEDKPAVSEVAIGTVAAVSLVPAVAPPAASVGSAVADHDTGVASSAPGAVDTAAVQADPIEEARTAPVALIPEVAASQATSNDVEPAVAARVADAVDAAATATDDAVTTVGPQIAAGDAAAVEADAGEAPAVAPIVVAVDDISTAITTPSVADAPDADAVVADSGHEDVLGVPANALDVAAPNEVDVGTSIAARDTDGAAITVDGHDPAIAADEVTASKADANAVTVDAIAVVTAVAAAEAPVEVERAAVASIVAHHADAAAAAGAANVVSAPVAAVAAEFGVADATIADRHADVAAAPVARDDVEEIAADIAAASVEPAATVTEPGATEAGAVTIVEEQAAERAAMDAPGPVVDSNVALAGHVAADAEAAPPAADRVADKVGIGEVAAEVSIGAADSSAASVAADDVATAPAESDDVGGAPVATAFSLDAPSAVTAVEVEHGGPESETASALDRNDTADLLPADTGTLIDATDAEVLTSAPVAVVATGITESDIAADAVGAVRDTGYPVATVVTDGATIAASTVVTESPHTGDADVPSGTTHAADSAAIAVGTSGVADVADASAASGAGKVRVVESAAHESIAAAEPDAVAPVVAGADAAITAAEPVEVIDQAKSAVPVAPAEIAPDVSDASPAVRQADQEEGVADAIPATEVVPVGSAGAADVGDSAGERALAPAAAEPHDDAAATGITPDGALDTAVTVSIESIAPSVEAADAVATTEPDAADTIIAEDAVATPTGPDGVAADAADDAAKDNAVDAGPTVTSAPGKRRRPRPAVYVPPRRVLLVEDDLDALYAMGRILTRLGHKVELAEDGPAALDAYDANGPFDLLVSDLTMDGGMSGEEVARTLQMRQPDLPVLFIAADDEDADDDNLLVKPVDQATLAGAISHVVNTQAVPLRSAP